MGVSAILRDKIDRILLRYDWISDFKGEWWNWQTRRVQGPVPARA